MSESLSDLRKRLREAVDDNVMGDALLTVVRDYLTDPYTLEEFRREASAYGMAGDDEHEDRRYTGAFDHVLGWRA